MAVILASKDVFKTFLGAHNGVYGAIFGAMGGSLGPWGVVWGHVRALLRNSWTFWGSTCMPIRLFGATFSRFWTQKRLQMAISGL